MAAKAHVTIFLLLVQIKVLYICNILWKFHSVKLIWWFWRYSMVNPYTLNIQESLKHAWHWGIGFLRCLAVKMLIHLQSKMSLSPSISNNFIWFLAARRCNGRDPLLAASDTSGNVILYSTFSPSHFPVISMAHLSNDWKYKRASSWYFWYLYMHKRLLFPYEYSFPS